MINYKFFYLPLLIISSIYTQTIFHQNIDRAIPNQEIIIESFIDVDYSKIKKVILHYKSSNQIKYLESKMNVNENNFFIAVIPKDYVKEGYLHYYITLELINNKLYSFPYNNPTELPLIIEILDNKNNKINIDLAFSSNDIQILSPLRGARVYKKDLLISLSYFNLKNIEILKTKVLLNNRDITSKVTFNDNYFIYKPDFILDGQYNVEVIFFDKYGRKLPIFKWNFIVISKDKLQGLETLLNHSGKFSNNYAFNNIGIEKLSVNNTNIDYRVNFDFLKIRNKVKISSLSNNFQQDKNRYLIDFKAPYINLQLGDSYPYINQYALNSYRVRGLNLKIDSKFFDFNFITGDLARAVVGNPDDDAIVIGPIEQFIDSTEFNSIYDTTFVMNISRDNYTFKRNVYGFNIGIGNPEKLFYNLSFIKAKDNTSTLSSINSNDISDYLVTIPTDAVYFINESYIASNNNTFTIDSIYTENGCVIDTSVSYSILYQDLNQDFNEIFGNNFTQNLQLDNWVGKKPKDNIVIGSNLKLALDNQNIIFNLGTSLSLLNQNIWEPTLSIESLDLLFDDNEDGMIMEDIELPEDFDFEQYEDIFQFSFNQLPLLPIDITSGKIGLEQILTMPSLAYNIDLTLKYLGHNIGMGIRQIGPEYNSLANPYLQQDIREQYINDKFRLINNRLFVNYGFKRIEDGIEVNQKSLSKTDKYNIGLSYYPGYDLPTYGLSFNLLDRDNGIDSLDVFTYQEYIGLGESFEGEEADELGYIEISDTTNRRESTSSFQYNFNISNNYKFYGSHNFLINFSKLKKKDLLYKEIITYDSLYFSPRTYNQTVVLNIKSTWTKKWLSNINYNYNYYSYGNNNYYQNQFLRLIDFKIFYYRFKKINLIKVGFNYSEANGNLMYNQFSSSISTKLEIIKNIFVDLDYEYRYRETINKIQKNKYFFVKASYNF